MTTQPLPFSARLRKPSWVLICPQTGRTAVYGVHGELMAHEASDALVAFAVDHFVALSLWSDASPATRPQQMARWMTAAAAGRCFLFALRDLYTPTDVVAATPDA